ncbi:MAG: FAD-dependent thymidylate synthase [Nitrospirota bacterium]
MKVELINHTPEPEKTIIKATRTCYQSFDRQNEVSDHRLLEHIVKNDESPLEFASFVFLVSGISRVTSHQIVRHRIASYAQKSQRYVSENAFLYIIPPEIEKNPLAKAEFLRIMEETGKAYNRMKELGIKNEDSRYLLPNACVTEIVCSYNGRSLRHFIRLRLSHRAQWEIREVAKQMADIVYKIAPILVGDLIK